LLKIVEKSEKMQIQFCWVPGEETYLF
jgi:hypothetical protein